MLRRDFLRIFGAAIATAAVPAIVEPARKLWFVPSNTPVGSRVEQPSWVDGNGRARFDFYPEWDLTDLANPDGHDDAADAARYAFEIGRRLGKTLTAADRVQTVDNMLREGLIEPREAIDVLMYGSDGVHRKATVTAADLRDMGVDPGPFMLMQRRTREELAAMYPHPARARQAILDAGRDMMRRAWSQDRIEASMGGENPLMSLLQAPPETALTGDRTA